MPTVLEHLEQSWILKSYPLSRTEEAIHQDCPGFCAWLPS